MLKSNFLSVPELAVRWQQTERQIIEHAIHKQLPLFFAYDGLAIDVNDTWHRETGYKFTWAKRNYENLCQNVDRLTKLLKINAMVRRGQYTPDEFEPYPLSPEEVKKYRAEIDADVIKRDELQERLNNRERERFKYDYRGYMRAAPLTLLEIEKNNKTTFPLMAYDPRYKCELKITDGRAVLDGRIMELERTIGSSRLKQFLLISDLLAPMEVIEAIEAAKINEVQTEPPPLIVKPVPRHRAQESFILENLKQLGYNPTALPPREGGKPWVKAEVKVIALKHSNTFSSDKTFEKAWERLRSSEEIKEVSP